jgi:heme exporter protein C
MSTTAAREERSPSSRARESNARGLLVMLAASCVAMLGALYCVFELAPLEQRMGIVYKLFYFHLPMAYAAYLGFIVCALSSVADLVTRRDRWDALAVSSAQVGLVFCAALMVVGSMWARKAWGVYWTWDPRLTTTLLLAMIFCAYVLLRSFSDGTAERRFGAGLAVLGVINLPIIHYSVERWRGTHPTVITSRGGGLDPSMWPPLLVSLLAVSLVCVLLIWLRTRCDIDRRRLIQLETEALARGLLPED